MYSQIAVNSGSTYSEKIISGILTPDFTALTQPGKRRVAIPPPARVERICRFQKFYFQFRHRSDRHLLQQFFFLQQSQAISKHFAGALVIAALYFAFHKMFHL